MFQPLAGTQISIRYQSHKRLAKKQYYDKTTNHHKDLEFLEDYHIFVVDVVPMSVTYRVKYEVYDDRATTSISKGIIQTTSQGKSIVITSNEADTEYFVLIQIYSDTNELIDTQHRFISRERISKNEEDSLKIHAANIKYLEENKSNLEEIVEYTSITRATGTVLTGADLLSSFLSQSARSAEPLSFFANQFPMTNLVVEPNELEGENNE